MRNTGIYGSFLGQRVWRVIVLFTKYIIIDPKWSWSLTETILPFLCRECTILYRECTTYNICKSPAFIQCLFGLKICILRALENESWFSWNSVATLNQLGSFKKTSFSEHLFHISFSTAVISLVTCPGLDFCYGYLGLFQYVYKIESSLTTISLIKRKMSNCLSSLVGTTAELLKHMLQHMHPLGTSDE